MFEKSILWLQDTGVMKRLLDDILKPRVIKPYTKARHKLPITFYQLSITMILFLIGTALSILIFILELKTSTKAKGKKKSNLNNLLELAKKYGIRKKPNNWTSSKQTAPMEASDGQRGQTTVVTHK